MRTTRTMKKTSPIRRKQDQATSLKKQHTTKIKALVALTSQILNQVEVPMMLNLILALVTSTICLRMQMIGPLLGIPPTQPYLVTPLSNH